MTRLLAALIATTAFAGPAFAEFYIVREAPTEPCKVVATRPTDPKIVIVGNTRGYKEQTEAVSQTAVLCKKD